MHSKKKHLVPCGEEWVNLVAETRQKKIRFPFPWALSPLVHVFFCLRATSVLNRWKKWDSLGTMASLALMKRSSPELTAWVLPASRETLSAGSELCAVTTCQTLAGRLLSHACAKPQWQPRQCCKHTCSPPSSQGTCPVSLMSCAHTCMASVAQHGARSSCLLTSCPASHRADLPLVSPGCPEHRICSRRLRTGWMLEEVLSLLGIPVTGSRYTCRL